MIIVENELKSLKKEYNEIISAEKRAKLDKYLSLLKQLGKHTFFKKHDEDPQNLLPSIHQQVHYLRRSIEAEAKMHMTDFQAYKWKNQKKKNLIVPGSFSKLKITETKIENINGKKAIYQIDFPILSIKNNTLCKIASQFLKENSFARNFTQDTIDALIENICSHYNILSYHNFSHAFSVFLLLLQSFHKCAKFKKDFSDFQVFTVLLSALCHDLSHPGTNSPFQIKKKSTLSLLYNNQSILQNMHISQLYKMLRNNPKIDVISSIKCPIQRERMKRMINRLILATDIQIHSKNLDSLKQVMKGKDSEQSEYNSLEKDIILENIFHGCDIGNPGLQFQNYMNWAILLSHQFHHQTLLERKEGLEVSGFMEYKDLPTFYRSQIGFINYLALPLWVEISSIYPQLSEVRRNMEQNREKLQRILQN